MRNRTISVIALLPIAALFVAAPAHALGTLSDEDKSQILALTEQVEQAIIEKNLVALQNLCDPWEGLWIDAGTWGDDPAPIIYYGWEQIPEILDDDHLYYLGWADGSGLPVYGRAHEIVWEGRWEVHDVLDPPYTGELWKDPWIRDSISLSEIMQENDGRELDAFTYPPANMVFYWQDKYHFVQYFYAGEDRNPQEPYDNQFWFLLFTTKHRWQDGKWCLCGIAHLDGWGI